jgi:hypothetical protein
MPSLQLLTTCRNLEGQKVVYSRLHYLLERYFCKNLTKPSLLTVLKPLVIYLQSLTAYHQQAHSSQSLLSRLFHLDMAPYVAQRMTTQFDPSYSSGLFSTKSSVVSILLTKHISPPKKLVPSSRRFRSSWIPGTSRYRSRCNFPEIFRASISPRV